MKRSVDLTENFIFSGRSRHISEIERLSRRKVNLVPWDASKGVYNFKTHHREKGTSFSLIKEETFSSTQSSSSTNSTLDFINTDEELFNNSFITENSWTTDTLINNDILLSNTSLYYRNNHHRTFSYFNENTDGKYISFTINYTEEDSDVVSKDDRFLGDYCNFPTGKVKEISSKRKRGRKFLSKSIENDNKLRTCKTCKKTFRRLPYSDAMSDYLCKECWKEENHKRHVKTIKVGKSWMTLRESRLNSAFNRDKLSSRFLPWDMYDLEETFGNHILKNHVIVKKKGMIVGWRQNPWQPGGRVEQPYDKAFDDLTWRKSLEMGLLQDNSLLSI